MTEIHGPDYADPPQWSNGRRMAWVAIAASVVLWSVIGVLIWRMTQL